MPIKLQYTTLTSLVFIFSLSSSCKEHVTMENQSEKIEHIQDSLNLVDLENIPFTMPIDWIYIKSPHPGLPSIVAQAVNPNEPQTLLTIADYEANSIEEFMSKMIKDQKKEIILDHTYTMNNDIVYTTTRYGEQIFLGKGIFGPSGDKLRFISITSSKELFKDRLSLIDEVLNSVTFDEINLNLK